MLKPLSKIMEEWFIYCTFSRFLFNNFPEGPLHQHQSVVEVGAVSAETAIFTSLPLLYGH